MIFYDNNTIPIVVGLGAPQVKRRWQDLSPYLKQFPGQPPCFDFREANPCDYEFVKSPILPYILRQEQHGNHFH
ncbi:MAG: hypothetical protein ACXWXZ_08150 [Candidatus Binatia bacterium]